MNTAISSAISYIEPPIPIKFTEPELKSIFEHIEWLESNNHLDFASNLRFSIVCGLTRDIAMKEARERIEKMVIDYVGDFFTKSDGDKQKFTNRCKWMVQAPLFQPPFLKLDTPKKREIYSRVMSTWNPQMFVNEFCERLNEVFLNL